MREYKITMADSRLGIRHTIVVEAFSCIEAGSIARSTLGLVGYDLIVSCVCIGWQKP